MSTKDSESRSQRLVRAFTTFESFTGLLQIRPKSSADGMASSRREQMVLTPIQRRYNRERTSRDIVLKPRQIYFTTLEAARDLWWFLTKPGARVVVCCQSQTDQAALKDIAEKFRIFFDSLGRLGLRLEFGRESATEWSLPRRDATLRIIQAGASEASAAKKGRGGTINRLHVTESAFFERAEDTFNSLMESIPRDGSEVVNESTPNGAGGFYYEQWKGATSGRTAYRAHFFRWWDHPDYRLAMKPGETFEPRTELEQTLLGRGIPVDNLNWYRWKIAEKGGNERLIAQEYPSDPASCFLLSGVCFFDAERLQLELQGAPEPIAVEEHGALRIWERPGTGKSYVVSSDSSEGGGGDASSAMVFERGTGKHVASLHGQFIPWDLASLLVKLGTMYNGAKVAPERNNHGHAVIDAMRRHHKYQDVYVHTDGKHGWLTNEASRALMLDALDSAHRRREFVTSDAGLLDEMSKFVIGRNGKAEASPGAHDDRVITAAIGWAVVTRTRAAAAVRIDPKRLIGRGVPIEERGVE